MILNKIDNQMRFSYDIIEKKFVFKINDFTTLTNDADKEIFLENFIKFFSKDEIDLLLNFLNNFDEMDDNKKIHNSFQLNTIKDLTLFQNKKFKKIQNLFIEINFLVHDKNMIHGIVSFETKKPNSLFDSNKIIDFKGPDQNSEIAIDAKQNKTIIFIEYSRLNKEDELFNQYLESIYKLNNTLINKIKFSYSTKNYSYFCPNEFMLIIKFEKLSPTKLNELLKNISEITKLHFLNLTNILKKDFYITAIPKKIAINFNLNECIEIQKISQKLINNNKNNYFICNDEITNVFNNRKESNKNNLKKYDLSSKNWVYKFNNFKRIGTIIGQSDYVHFDEYNKIVKKNYLKTKNTDLLMITLSLDILYNDKNWEKEIEKWNSNKSKILVFYFNKNLENYDLKKINKIFTTLVKSGFEIAIDNIDFSIQNIDFLIKTKFNYFILDNDLIIDFKTLPHEEALLISFNKILKLKKANFILKNPTKNSDINNLILFNMAYIIYKENTLKLLN